MGDKNPIKISEPASWRITAVLILIHLVIAIPLAWILNIWADEASTLYTTQNGFLNAFRHALTDEKQAPLYFWLLSLWRGIDGSIFFARLFSILCSVIAIKFFFDLANRLFTRNAAIFVAAVFALHPFLIWASLEIRVYSFIALLGVLLLKFFEDGFLNGDDRKKARVLFLVFAIIGLYSSYYIGFLLVGCFIALPVTRRWKAAKSYILLMIIAGAAILPLLQAIRAQFATDSASFHGTASLTEGLQIIWNFVLTFVLPTEVFTPETQTDISVVRLWIVRMAVVAAVFLLIGNRKRIDDRLLAYGAIAAVIAGFLLLSYFLLGDVYVQIRHSAVLFAPVILAAALVIDRAAFTNGENDGKRFRSFLAPGALALLLLGFFSYSIYSLYPNLTKRGDWERVAAFIKGKEKPGQPIVIFTTFDALALPYYYRGENKILPDEKYFAWEPEAAFGTEASHKKQTEFVISEIPPGAGEVWLVVNEKCLAREACLPLENYVKSNYTIVEEKEFYLEKVFLLRRKPQ